MTDPTARSDLQLPQETRLAVLPPIASLIELGLLFAALLAIDWLMPGLELMDFRPHPFWLPVVLISLQYGTVSGLLAAAIAVGLTASAGFPEQQPSQTYFAYLLKIWLEPGLWIATAVLIGQFRMRQIARKQRLSQHVAELTRERDTLAGHAARLRAHCAALERQIAGRNQADGVRVLAALHSAHEAGIADRDHDLDVTFATALSTTFRDATASLYLLDTTGLALAATAGQSPARQTTIAAGSPLHHAIVTEGRSLSVLSAADEPRLAGAGVAAVPVLALAPAGSRERRVVGMVKLEHVSPGDLDDLTLPALFEIGRAFAPALEARIGLRAPVAAATATSGTTDAIHPAGFMRRLRWFRGGKADEPAPVASDDAPRSRSASSVNH